MSSNRSPTAGVSWSDLTGCQQRTLEAFDGAGVGLGLGDVTDRWEANPETSKGHALMALGHLRALGLLEENADIYSLTDAGRELLAKQRDDEDRLIADGGRDAQHYCGICETGFDDLSRLVDHGCLSSDDLCEVCGDAVDGEFNVTGDSHPNGPNLLVCDSCEGQTTEGSA